MRGHRLRRRAGGSDVPRANRRNRTAALADAGNDTDFLDIPVAAQVAHREGIKSFAHAPISIEGEPVGVLSVFSLSAKGIFTEEFVDLFTNLAGQVGVALRNARQTEHLIAAREREREMAIARSIQLFGVHPWDDLHTFQSPGTDEEALQGRCGQRV